MCAPRTMQIERHTRRAALGERPSHSKSYIFFTFNSNSIHIHYIHAFRHMFEGNSTYMHDGSKHTKTQGIFFLKKEKKTRTIHSIKLLQIVKSTSSISNGTRVQLCPKRIGYVRRTFIKQIHLYSIGSAKWLGHFALANWAIRKSVIFFSAFFLHEYSAGSFASLFRRFFFH